jgi:arylsulfatase A-like enzyme
LNDRLTDEAVDFLRKNKEKPFMLVLAHYAVHTPFQAPEDMVKSARAELRKAGKEAGGKSDDPDFKNSDEATDKTVQNNPIYAAMVKSMDDSVGRVMAELDALGLSNNTLVILTSDHGGLSTRSESSQRPLATTNLPYRHGKGWLYDGGLRVPMIAKWPGVVKPGVSHAQTLGTDHYATILEAVGLSADPDEAPDSVSYLPALKGESFERGPMFFHSPQSRPKSTGDRDASALIVGKWKIFEHLDSGKLELYDLESDPGELKDLAATEKDRLAEMRTLLEKTKRETNARQGGKNPFAGERKKNE